jgi:hypothetical protein
MILVYSENITNRHRYIFDFIFGDILGVKCAFTSSKEEFFGYNGPKFSYGVNTGQEEIHFADHPLLREQGIREQQIELMEWNDLTVFFGVNGDSVWPFDPFALAFYLVSRYEEYLPFETDEHDRFRVEDSLAFRGKFLEIPLIDMIARQMEEMISDHFSNYQFPMPKYRFIPTFDIDIAYAHLGKGFFRASAAWAKLFLTFKFGEVRERLLTIMGKMNDPYDNFNFQQDISTQYGYTSIYFTLLGDFGKYDRNTSHQNHRFRKLLRRLSRHADMGIHPSYRSFQDYELFQKERRRLESILGKPVEKNRFHFLRFRFPESYRLLLRAGITDDYTMGYSTACGFRASTCTPFDFYDLEKEEQSGLKLHPFIFMDSAMIDHMDLTPEQAEVEIDQILQAVRECGGEAIGIWHNYALSEKYQYKGWRHVLDEVLKDYNNQSL